MLRLLADENLVRAIVRGLLRHEPTLDIQRVQDVGLLGQSDSVVLDWAAREGRVLLTHDARSMPRHVEERIRAGLPTPPVIIVPSSLSVGQAIDDILLLAQCGRDTEWHGSVIYLPL